MPSTNLAPPGKANLIILLSWRNRPTHNLALEAFLFSKEKVTDSLVASEVGLVSMHASLMLDQTRSAAEMLSTDGAEQAVSAATAAAVVGGDGARRRVAGHRLQVGQERHRTAVGIASR